MTEYRIDSQAFLNYWQAQKKMADSFPLSYKIIERNLANKHAKYYDIVFNSMDGSQIHAKYIRPTHEQRVPIVFDFHDYKDGSQGWFHLTRYNALGYGVVAMDCRGQGGESLDASPYGNVAGVLLKGMQQGVDAMYYRNVFLDAYLLSTIVMQLPAIDTSKMISYGKGQGGAIALAVAVLNPRIKKCSMLYPLLCDIKEAYQQATQGMYKELTYYFRMQDASHQKEDVIYQKLDYIDMINFAPNVTCEVLMGSALRDQVAPHSCQTNVFNRILTPKKQIVFPTYEHERINFFENENMKFMRFD